MPLFNFGYNQNQNMGPWRGFQNTQQNFRSPWNQADGYNGYYPAQQSNRQFWNRNSRQNNNVPPMFSRQNNNTAPQANTFAATPTPLEPQHLPDGVTIHPLDQNTMNEIRRGNMGVLGSVGPQPTIHEVPEQGDSGLERKEEGAFEKNASIDICEKLRGFIHDERNASLFYKYLSGIAPRNDYRNMIMEISEGCSQRKKIFGDIYSGIKGENFTPADAVVDTSVSFDDGLRWAISVENRALKGLSDLYESTSDGSVSKRLSTQMYKKLCDLSSLHLMLK